jgi:hypothetical protein
MRKPLRRLLALTSAVAVIALGIGLPQPAVAQTDPLVQLLTQKGVLTPGDAASIAAVPHARQRDKLVEILQSKGILTPQDVHSLPTAPPMPVPVYVPAPVPPLPHYVPGPPAYVMPAPQPIVAPPPIVPVLPSDALPVYVRRDSPLTFNLGEASLEFGGFVDALGIYRTTNTGNVASTLFGLIPFKNTVAGNQSETHLTGQMSRLSLRFRDAFDFLGERTDVLAYVESDFNGNDPGDVFVTSNSHTARLRQAYADVMRGPWEVVGGQVYGWLTPNQIGLSNEADALFLTMNYDSNFNVGMPWTRAAAARIIYHVNPQLAVGIGVENPQQYATGVTFPAAFNTQLAQQLALSNPPGAPNPEPPDILAKAAYDGSFMGHQFHLETVGLLSEFRVSVLPAGGTTNFRDHYTTGYGFGFNGNVELIPGLRGFLDGFYSEGGGRYLDGVAPDIVVFPNATGTNVSLRTVRSAAVLTGLEWYALETTKVGAYWGADFIGKAYTRDTTSPLAIKPNIGYGFPGSPNTDNAVINEFTFDAIHDIWSNPQWGTLQGGVQYSHLWRFPWFHAAGAPSSATTDMLFFDLRFIFPP